MLDNVDTYPRPTDERDLRDLAALAQGMMPLTRCPGGRWTTKNNSHCAHCGISRWDNPGLCGQPLGEDGYTPFDATVAMRIMAESETNYEGD